MLLQQLTYFAAVARERHFGRAAEACNVSQPTLSYGIRRLENELGMALIRRGRTFHGLTPEGERMLEWAHRILGDAGAMQLDAAALRTGLTGRLRVGAIPTTLPAMTLLSGPLLGGHGGVEVAIYSLTSREIERGLNESSLDIGVTYLENEPLRGVRTLPLYDERYLLLTAADGPHGGADEVGWREAADERLCLLTPDMQNRRIVDGAFAAAGARPRPVVETNSISTLYAHVRAGVVGGVVAHTWLHLYPVPAGMRAVPLVRPDVRQSIGLVWPDHRAEPLLTQALITTVRDVDLVAVLNRSAASGR